MRSMRIRRLLPIALALCLVSAGLVRAELRAEYEVKAAFLLNFVRLCQWPEASFSDPEAPFQIGVFVDDPFEGTLDGVLRGQRVRGRAVHARRVASEAEVRSVHLLFVPATQADSIERIRGWLAGAPVLVVGESKQFAERGGAVNLYAEQGRIRFEINRRVAEQSGLKLSSRLLRLARLIDPDE